MPTIKYNKPIEYNYNNEDYDDFDFEEEEIEFEISWEQLEKDKDIKYQYAREFAYKYEMDIINAEKLLNDYDIWFGDSDINKEIFENNAKELYEKYYLEEE